MDQYIYDENNGLWYERCGDYYLPCLTLPEEKSVGKWGQKYRAYLRKHKREVYNAFSLAVPLTNTLQKSINRRRNCSSSW